MNRRSRLPQRIIAAAAFAACLAYAPVDSYALEDSGYEVLDTREVEDTVRRTVRDAEGNEFEVRSAEESLSDRQVRILDVVVRTVYTIDALDVESMRILFADERADILVVPSSLEYDGEELADYMPSGLQFAFNQVLEYDFRVLVDEYFLRFAGQYIDEELFLSRLAEAIDDPVGFLESQRPEFLARRLDEVEEAVASLTRAFEDQSAELADTREVLEQTREELNGTREQLNGTREALTEARAEVFDLRYAVLAFNNSNWFGRDRPIDEEVIDRIVELKRANPEIERGEIRDRLSEEDLDVSSNEVYLVLSVYFGEFD